MCTSVETAQYFCKIFADVVSSNHRIYSFMWSHDLMIEKFAGTTIADLLLGREIDAL